MSLCDCAFGPRCESNRCCEDEAATIGLKDRRTGTIRARADCSMMHPWSRGSTPRVLFYCDPCWEVLIESWTRPITGIDPPKGASDFWRPSITEMVRHAAMEINRKKAAQQPPVNYSEAVIQFEIERMRRRGFTPAQRAQAEFVRRQMRR